MNRYTTQEIMELEFDGADEEGFDSIKWVKADDVQAIIEASDTMDAQNDVHEMIRLALRADKLHYDAGIEKCRRIIKAWLAGEEGDEMSSDACDWMETLLDELDGLKHG